MLIDIQKEHLGVMMEAGYILIGMRRYKEARELFEGLASLAPDSDIPQVALGNVEFCEGRLARAIVLYKRALKLDPESVFAKVYLGEALLFAGKKDEAMELIGSVADADKSGAGEFARALKAAVRDGFDPDKLPKEHRKGKI